MRYRITPIDPNAHRFEVELLIAYPDPQGQQVAMPAWTPGSYMIREFARNVVSIEASSASGRRIALRKLDKATWQAVRCDEALRIRYQVYAWDLSVRAAHLDSTHGFFNGPSVFLRAIGHESLPCELQIDPPAGDGYDDWRVATTMPSAGAREHAFGAYRARDYAELIDHPVEMGRFTLASFDVGGARHEIAITGRHDADADRLCRDLRRVCGEQVRLFEPRRRRAPFDRYLFQVLAIGSGYGGLEHRSSASLLCSRNELPHRGEREPSEGYRSFLGLASHEYFHAWNVKRIRPSAFVAPDLQNESYTRLLWIFEGFTSYYDDLMLVRSRVVDRDAYLGLLAKTISNVQRGPGRRGQSVAESSFDAWIKFYRQDENSPNAVVSYYAKGSLVALALDLTIRERTRGRRSLDDVLRALWERFGRSAFVDDVGLDEDAFPRLLEDVVGLRLDAQIRAWAYGTAELPLAALLRRFGVRLELGAGDQGPVTIGARLTVRDGQLTLATAYNGQAAERAGLSAGDAIVAFDGLRVADEATCKALLARRRPGDRLQVHAFRRDELIEREVVLAAPAATEAKLVQDERASAAVQRLRDGWLGAATGTVRPAPRPAPPRA
ncbi:MAG TPA: PDZ domain-containing protein [Zeimonas sp.]